jgi:hypothetical protein
VTACNYDVSTVVITLPKTYDVHFHVRSMFMFVSMSMSMSVSMSMSMSMSVPMSVSMSMSVECPQKWTCRMDMEVQHGHEPAEFTEKGSMDINSIDMDTKSMDMDMDLQHGCRHGYTA